MKLKWQMLLYDIGIFAMSNIFILLLIKNISPNKILLQIIISACCLFISRLIGHIYGLVWRYGGVQCYIKLMITDMVAIIMNIVVLKCMSFKYIPIDRLCVIYCVDLFWVLLIRMVYRYAYKYGNNKTRRGRFLLCLIKMFAPKIVSMKSDQNTKKINIAIIGAGKLGVNLADDLLIENVKTQNCYYPRCFVDIDKSKVGRFIHNLPVFKEGETAIKKLKNRGVTVVIFTVMDLSREKRNKLYSFYKKYGFKIKIYECPATGFANNKNYIHNFNISELLFRNPVIVNDEKIAMCYRNKTILITGGGGSIGSELCRQLVTMQPAKIILLDIYENGAYDILQELKIVHDTSSLPSLYIEIVSVCNYTGLERVFTTYHPQIVIHAAAHKHVPLMEKNCIEAVQNNVFGTLNVVKLSKKYEVDYFILVSTDKAVNPTNVMGATKRICERIVQSYSLDSTKTKFSAVRFGNVLGSAGSVIPLFKKQIDNGGPITITDKRIIRYFMTIEEASQLILCSGAMANNGELFVLDMGDQVKILDLAENMIKLNGFEPYKDIDIVEIGLRPGEKLYEEMLMNSETLSKTENNLIFIEKDVPLSMDEITEKLDMLSNAIVSDKDEIVKQMLLDMVPTYHTPQQVNDTILSKTDNTNDVLIKV